MTDADRQFLLAVLADPADDSVRMAWADHLQDRGHPAGEFMAANLTVSLFHDSQLEESRQSNRYAAAMLRCERSHGAARSLMQMLFDGAEWSEPCGLVLSWLDESKSGMFVFDRGLPSICRCPMDWWMEHGPAVVAGTPIENVELTDRNPREESAPLWTIAYTRSGSSWTWYDSGWCWNNGQSVRAASERWHTDRSALWYDLARHIRGDRVSRGRFRSREEAVKTLSDCCLIYARQEAVQRGLVPDGMWGIVRDDRGVVVTDEVRYAGER